MSPQANLRRIGWFALLGVCTLLYGLLHFQVWSLSSEVKIAERRIVWLERDKMLLETEFLTRSSQLQLAAWNRVDFGYTAPRAEQFLVSERQLSDFGIAAATPDDQPIQVAAYDAGEEAPPFPRLVSPITGEPLDDDLVNPAASDHTSSGTSVIALAERPARTALAASHGAAATVRITLGGAGE